MNRWPSFGGGGGGCFWSWFTWLESGSLSSSPTSLRLLMFHQVWSRAWCSCNLNWDFLLSWKVGDSNSALWVLYIPWEVLKSSVHAWRVAAPSRDAPPGRAVRPASVKVSLCLAHCVKHNFFLSMPDFWPGTNSCPLAMVWQIWSLSQWQAVVSLQLCSGAGAPGSMSPSLLAEVWQQETRFLR